jgi:hypothetical protein
MHSGGFKLIEGAKREDLIKAFKAIYRDQSFVARPRRGRVGNLSRTVMIKGITAADSFASSGILNALHKRAAGDNLISPKSRIFQVVTGDPRFARAQGALC